MSNYEKIEEGLETYVFPHISNCPVLRLKVTYLSNFLVENRELILPAIDSKDYRNITTVIDLYGPPLDSILQKYYITNDTEIRATLQLASIVYIFAQGFKNFGLSVKTLKKRLAEIEKTSSKLIKLLKLDSEISLLLAGLYSNLLLTKEDLPPYIADKKFISLSEDLKILTELNSSFTATPLAKWLQYGMSGPKENSALDVWVFILAELWTCDLKRELSFTSDKHAGRNNFLNFTEECIWEIHPNVGHDAIRNTYEKLRSNGKLDYLKKIQ